MADITPEPFRPEIRKPLFSPKPVDPVPMQQDSSDETDEDELDIPAFIRKKMK